MKGTVQLVQTNNNRDIVELPRQLELGLVWKGLNLGGGGGTYKRTHDRVDFSDISSIKALNGA